MTIVRFSDEAANQFRPRSTNELEAETQPMGCQHANCKLCVEPARNVSFSGSGDCILPDPIYLAITQATINTGDQTAQCSMRYGTHTLIKSQSQFSCGWGTFTRAPIITWGGDISSSTIVDEEIDKPFLDMRVFRTSTTYRFELTERCTLNGRLCLATYKWAHSGSGWTPGYFVGQTADEALATLSAGGLPGFGNDRVDLNDPNPAVPDIGRTVCGWLDDIYDLSGDTGAEIAVIWT